jgi:hypothetical protein
VKVGVWVTVSDRWLVGPVIFNETINCEGYILYIYIYILVILGQFFPELTEEERFYG